MRYLLDTNTCIAVMRNHPKVVMRMAASSPGDCGISTITYYELCTGVAKSANPAREKAKVDFLVRTVQLLPFEMIAANEAGRLRAFLESQGTPIGPYDTLLAGQASALSLTLVTNNVKEFSRVPGLAIENWQA